MKHGNINPGTRSTRKGDREILSVSLPISLYDAMMKVCEHYDMPRSVLMARAVKCYLCDLGIKVGEE